MSFVSIKDAADQTDAAITWPCTTIQCSPGTCGETRSALVSRQGLGDRHVY